MNSFRYNLLFIFLILISSCSDYSNLNQSFNQNSLDNSSNQEDLNRSILTATPPINEGTNLSGSNNSAVANKNVDSTSENISNNNESTVEAGYDQTEIKDTSSNPETTKIISSINSPQNQLESVNQNLSTYSSEISRTSTEVQDLIKTLTNKEFFLAEVKNIPSIKDLYKELELLKGSLSTATNTTEDKNLTKFETTSWEKENQLFYETKIKTLENKIKAETLYKSFIFIEQVQKRVFNLKASNVSSHKSDVAILYNIIKNKFNQLLKLKETEFEEASIEDKNRGEDGALIFTVSDYPEAHTNTFIELSKENNIYKNILLQLIKGKEADFENALGLSKDSLFNIAHSTLPINYTELALKDDLVNYNIAESVGGFYSSGIELHYGSLPASLESNLNNIKRLKKELENTPNPKDVREKSQAEYIVINEKLQTKGKHLRALLTEYYLNDSEYIELTGRANEVYYSTTLSAAEKNIYRNEILQLKVKLKEEAVKISPYKELNDEITELYRQAAEDLSQNARTSNREYFNLEKKYFSAITDFGSKIISNWKQNQITQIAILNNKLPTIIKNNNENNINQILSLYSSENKIKAEAVASQYLKEYRDTVFWYRNQPSRLIQRAKYNERGNLYLNLVSSFPENISCTNGYSSLLVNKSHIETEGITIGDRWQRDFDFHRVKNKDGNFTFTFEKQGYLIKDNKIIQFEFFAPKPNPNNSALLFSSEIDPKYDISKIKNINQEITFDQIEYLDEKTFISTFLLKPVLSSYSNYYRDQGTGIENDDFIDSGLDKAKAYKYYIQKINDQGNLEVKDLSTTIKIKKTEGYMNRIIEDHGEPRNIVQRYNTFSNKLIVKFSRLNYELSETDPYYVKKDDTLHIEVYDIIDTENITLINELEFDSLTELNDNFAQLTNSDSTDSFVEELPAEYLSNNEYIRILEGHFPLEVNSTLLSKTFNIFQASDEVFIYRDLYSATRILQKCK